MYVQYNIKEHSCNYCCCGKAINITYSECVSVALGIQHTNCMPHVILSSVTCLAVKYFSTLSHKCYDFRKNKMYVLIFSTTFV
jgi:hypothetical protein